MARTQVDFSGRAVACVIEGENSHRLAIAEQQNPGPGWALGFEAKTVFRGDQFRRNLDLLFTGGPRAFNAAAHLDQLGNLEADP
jgi:hypothetical protein